MGKINILNKLDYMRIAAGEVVERPFAAVKELIENSIDAKAKNVEISIYNGGKDLIQIIDDGVGIEKDDLPKAILPHATSKISRFEDLDNIVTLGFRGEALASIAAVSVLTIISRTKDEDTGYKIIAKDDSISDITPAASERGTMISVENLFYNTPARAKFMKSSAQEEADITSMVKHLVFANPDIAFKYSVDGNLVLQTDGCGLDSAFIEVFGYKTLTSCLKLDVIKHGIRFSGYIGKADFTKPNRTYQTIFLNSRLVSNSTIQSAIHNAYAPYLMKRQYPFYLLTVDIPPQFVDVNVNPNKTDVRFSDNQSIYGLFYSVIKETLERPHDVSSIEDSQIPLDNTIFENTARKSEKRLGREFKISELPPNITPDFFQYPDNEKPVDRSVYDPDYLKAKEKSESLDDIFLENKKYAEELENLKKSKLDQGEIEFVEDFKVIGQALSTYIILERGGDLFFVDQHAAHERLLFDEFEKDFKYGKVENQSMLVPYIFTVNEKEYVILDAKREALIKMGFDFCDYDYLQFAVYSVPILIWDIDLKEFFDDILSDNELKRTDVPEIVHEKLAQKACKAAIKSGKNLSEKEIATLLDELKYDLTLKCPHGRPIALKITRTEIDKWFKRIV